MTRVWLWAAIVALLAAGGGAYAWHAGRADRALAERMPSPVPDVRGATRPCRAAPGAGLTVLILGQSLAGNHAGEAGIPPDGSHPRLTVFDGRACRRVGDPLPFATGAYHSVWSDLESELQRLNRPGELIAALLAVHSSSIDDWTRNGSPLRDRLDGLLAAMQQAGLRPDLVLWQQGEADALQGTRSADYVARFEQLRGRLRAGGVDAPILVARSTLCRDGNGEQVRHAVDLLIGRHADVLPGPDTDTLVGLDRLRGCHLSRWGGRAAARLWAESIVATWPTGLATR